MGDFWLVGCVSGVPSWIFKYVALEDFRKVGVVVSRTDPGFEDSVLAGDLMELRQSFLFAQGFCEMHGTEVLDAFGDDALGQFVEARIAELAEHLLDFVFARADVSADKRCVGMRRRGGFRSRMG